MLLKSRAEYKGGGGECKAGLPLLYSTGVITDGR
jgi:hypothetical protein